MYYLANVQLWIVLAVLAVPLLIGGGWLLHRFCIKLEEAGYLYYRTPNERGGGALYELDKLTRPSMEHVIEVQDPISDEQTKDGD